MAQLAIASSPIGTKLNTHFNKHLKTAPLPIPYRL